MSRCRLVNTMKFTGMNSGRNWWSGQHLNVKTGKKWVTLIMSVMSREK